MSLSLLTIVSDRFYLGRDTISAVNVRGSLDRDPFELIVVCLVGDSYLI